jgi:hypothetical protein
MSLGLMSEDFRQACSKSNFQLIIREFEAKLQYVAFGAVRDRVRLITYEQLSEYHTKANEAAAAAVAVGE